MRIFFTLTLSLCLFSCRPVELTPPLTAPPETLPASVKQLTIEQAASLIQSTPELKILDAREEWEIKQDGRIAEAIYIDYLNMNRMLENTSKLDPQKPYLIYCAIGGRSRLAAAVLEKQGFTQLSILSGGFEAWLAAGRPVQK